MLTELEILPNISEKLWFLFRECLLSQSTYCISQNSHECENVIKNVIKIIIFCKIAINYKSNYSIKNVIRLHYLITLL